jgi:predicted hydrocarbon binding protein
MKRNDFIKTACMCGICSCAGITMSPAVASASDDKKETDWRVGFMQKRFTKLLEKMNSDVEGATRIKLIEDMGRACAAEHPEFYMKFKGNPEGYLEELKKQWSAEVVYDKKEGSIRIVGPKRESCFCPFVSKSETPKEFCDCSVGFNKQAFENVLGKPVEVKVERSILRGSERCVYLIRVG